MRLLPSGIGEEGSAPAAALIKDLLRKPVSEESITRGLTLFAGAQFATSFAVISLLCSTVSAHLHCGLGTCTSTSVRRDFVMLCSTVLGFLGISIPSLGEGFGLFGSLWA